MVSAYTFNGDLRNARKKFADVILKTELMIMQFNASNVITSYSIQCCTEKNLKSEV